MLTGKWLCPLCPISCWQCVPFLGFTGGDARDSKERSGPYGDDPGAHADIPNFFEWSHIW